MLMNPHNQHLPPGSMPPTQYNQYGQMPNMQQAHQNIQPYPPMDYQPCSPMPPQQMYPAFQPTAEISGGYPCSPAPPPMNNVQQQMHPAFHQPSPLPGGYPSPSRRPPVSQNMQNVTDWLGSYNNQPFSPAPSVAPSVMSHASVNLPPNCDGSMMSMPGSMMHCPTPDLRPASVLSSMSCSENLDPNMMSMMQNGGQPLAPQQPQSIAGRVAVLCDLFDKRHCQNAIYELNALHKMFRDNRKRAVEFESCTSLLPRILRALCWREAEQNQDVMMVLTRSFMSFTGGLSDQALLKQFPPLQEQQNSQEFAILARAAGHPQYWHNFVKLLDIIIRREASKQERKFLRNPQFLSNLLMLLTPPHVGATFRPPFLFLLSIISGLATNHVETAEYLVQQKIIPKLFHGDGLHRICVYTLQLAGEEHKPMEHRSYVLKTVRQMINLLEKIMPRRKDKFVAVYSEFIACGGLHAITEYMFYVRSLSMERDFVDERGAIILNHCTNQVMNGRISEIPEPKTLVTNILYILRRSPLLQRRDDVLMKCDFSPDVNCMNKLVTFLSHLTEFNNDAKITLIQNYKELVYILAEFNIWFTKCKSFRSDGSGAWNDFQRIFKKNFNDMIDYQDSLVYIGNRVVEDCANGGILDQATITLLLEVTVRVHEVDSASDWENEKVREIVRRTSFMMRKIISILPQLVSTEVISKAVGFRKENILSTSFNAMSTLLEYTLTSVKNEEEEKLIVQTVARIFVLLGIIHIEASVCKPPTIPAQQVKNSIIALITNNYTPVIVKWLGKVKDFCDRSGQLNSLNSLLLFCETVSKDTQVAKFWATGDVGEWMVSFFDSLSSSQDPDQSSRAQHVVEELRKHQYNSSDTSDYMHMMIM